MKNTISSMLGSCQQHKILCIGNVSRNPNAAAPGRGSAHGKKLRTEKGVL